MRRVRSFCGLCTLIVLVAALGGCGKKSSGVIETSIHITPATLSLEQGKFAALSVADSSGTGIAIGRITWLASNSSAISIAPLNGSPTVCAGTWDSTTAPTVCNPGPAGAVHLTATANGATSPPITVFVHQHIDRLVATQLDTGICPSGPAPIAGCLSTISLHAPACFTKYQVQAFNNNNDITSTVGPITWNEQNSTVMTLTTTGSGLLFNQAQATAKTPGQTTFFASAGNATSADIPFTTCAVDSISLQTATGGNSLDLPKGSAAETITAMAIDANGLTLVNPPLTWSSTNSTVASVSTTGTITGSQTGGAAVTASCLPTTCNIGFLPAAPPIYPAVGISVQVSGTASSSTAYAASSGCWDRANGPVPGCVSSIIPIPQTTNVPGAPITLPHIPTSMMIGASGTEIYVGSCVPTSPTNAPICNGIAVVSSTGSVSINNSVTGDVIGVAPSGTKAAIADNSTTPNQLFIYDQPSNSGTQFLLPTTDHAKSAVFSADAFLAYITTYQCTGSPCQTSNEVAGPVYSYDAFNGLRKLSTPTGVTDVAFHPSGALVYMVQASHAVTTLNTSDNSIAASPNSTQILGLPGAPQFIRAARDWNDLTHITHFIVLNGPGAPDAEVLSATSETPPPSPIPPPPPPPCYGSNPFAICNAVDSHVDLGQGSLLASQFLLSTDGTTAYVIPQNFASVFAYNLLSQNNAGVSLIGAQPPTTGGLTSDGAFLYVGSKDGLVHVLSTGPTLNDTLQIQPINTTTNPATSMCSVSTALQPCYPDFVVVKP